MKTITYDPATHVLVPREPTPGMLKVYKQWHREGKGYMDASIYKAMLEAAPPQSSYSNISNSWQPIETAPKDGTHILIFGTFDNMLYPKEEQVVGQYSRGWWSGNRVLSHVTHWMPLPRLPEAKS